MNVIWMIRLSMAGLLALACNTQEPTPTPTPTPVPTRAPAQPPPAAAPSAPAVIAEHGPLVGAGDWVASDVYDFKLEGLRPCGRAAQKHLGATVSIKAKVDELAISPRDVTIDSAGVIFQAEFPAAATAAGCESALPLRQLRRGQSVTGVVVFKIPDDFTPEPKSPKLVYRPTRWGGAGRVQVSVPDCLHRCTGLAAEKRNGKARQRTLQ
jgi:hypothetical protein